jgi:hypothetical protein
MATLASDEAFRLRLSENAIASLHSLPDWNYLRERIFGAYLEIGGKQTRKFGRRM